MDTQILEAYSKRPDVKETIRANLEIFLKQNIETKIALAEKILIRNNVGEAIVEDLLDENIALEEKLKEYENKHGPINSDYLNKFDSDTAIVDSKKNKKKKQKLLQLLSKRLQEGRLSM